MKSSIPQTPKTPGRWAWLPIVPLTLLFLLAATGCTRQFFRERADRDVEGVLTQKNIFPDWQIEQFHLYPDGRARFADMGNPDRPIRPTDDPAVSLVSPDPQPTKRFAAPFEGTEYLNWLAAWDAANRTEAAANPATVGTSVVKPTPRAKDDSLTRALQSNEKAYLLKLEQASELALFNSREFQDRREDLYLTALEVTLQRFSFAGQFSAIGEVVRVASGRDTIDGQGNRWRGNGAVGFSRLFPTGALLVLRLANQLVIELGNNRPTISVSALTAELAQPLLAGAGRAVTMEALTQAERTLLYAIRSYARFRKVYYAYIAGGSEVNNSPLNFAGLATRIFGPNFQAPSQGFLPTLLLRGQRDNEAASVAILEDLLQRFRAYKEGGDYSELQVGQVEQQLLRSRSSLLQRQLDYQNGLDLFKLQLGLPIATPLELDNEILKPMADQLQRYQQIVYESESLRDLVQRDLIRLPPEKVRDYLRQLFREAALVRGTRFREEFPAKWQGWEKLGEEAIKKRLADLSEERRQVLEKRTEFEAQNQPIPPDLAARERVLEVELSIGLFEQSLRRYESKPWEKELQPGRGEKLRELFAGEVGNNFLLVIIEARTQRLNEVRSRWPALPPIVVCERNLLEGDLDEALTIVAQTALAERLDLMNARAQLVDSWRQIRIRANALMGVLNVRYLWDSTTPEGENNPFALGGSRNTHRVFINGELPLVRRAERNQFRTALIAYQRQRRALMASEDFVLSNVRTTMRQLRVLSENYKIQQRAVELAYTQLENALEVLIEPPSPVAGGRGNAAANAAALTSQLLQAQQSLPQAQNQLYQVWVNYLIARLELYRDLERMPLDARGVWLDELTTLDRRIGYGIANLPEVIPGGYGADSPRLGELAPPPRKDPK